MTHMAYYEHVVIARQDISPQQAEALNDQLKAVIDDHGQTRPRQDDVGEHRLQPELDRLLPIGATRFTLEVPIPPG